MTPVRASIYGLVVGLSVWVSMALCLRLFFPEASDLSPLKEALVTIVIIASSIAAGVYVARTRMNKQDSK